eukprot:7282919-Pyramimonas_sp.AAC.1
MGESDAVRAGIFSQRTNPTARTLTNAHLAGLELLVGAGVVEAHHQRVAPVRHLLAKRRQDGCVLAPDATRLRVQYRVRTNRKRGGSIYSA